MACKNHTIKIAIDGPAGSGKSTVAQKIADLLGIFYLNSGALYRIIGYYLDNQQINPEDSKTIMNKIDDIEIVIKNNKYYLNGEDVSDKIKNAKSGMLASIYSKNAAVREKVNHLIKEISKKNSVVVDGRDIGTEVLPNSDIKIFLTASLEERARRRWKELKERGENVSYQDILKEIEERDKADSTRNISPLRPAEDAIIIDTTNKTIEDVIQEIVNILKEKGLYGNTCS
ncbi:MAG: (d)CMP kinase [Defluviitoga tunisiensis]|jgi:cytidylate kinase|nr:(d)CMP kinase [Defluviitoga tunisiensis]HOL86331.1 (d)CMP kinase [Defluviitoga tunisiensis]HOP34232.1 (d)CMP kinase [Defluviitoga tunisiensis]HPP09969.1 (d)CMP kinase [Defluviitoga tunisiensis]